MVKNNWRGVRSVCNNPSPWRESITKGNKVADIVVVHQSSLCMHDSMNFSVQLDSREISLFALTVIWRLFIMNA